MFIDCVNVVNLYFVGLLYVIVEYCRFGNLRGYLLSKRPAFLDTMETSMETVTKLEKSESISNRSTNGGKPEYINTSARLGAILTRRFQKRTRNYHLMVCVSRCKQGSHRDRKTWKNGKAFSSQRKSGNLINRITSGNFTQNTGKTKNNTGKVREISHSEIVKTLQI